MSYFKRKFRGRVDFSYKVDYVKAIAEDEAAIALAERAIHHGWWKPESWASYHTTIMDMVVYHVARPATVPSGDVATFTPGEFGLSREDVSHMAYYCYGGSPGLDTTVEALIDESAGVPGRYDRGNAAFHKLKTAFGTENVRTLTQLQADLRRAKTARARHRRNQTKYGAAS